jgi:hypothetical protein
MTTPHRCWHIEQPGRNGWTRVYWIVAPDEHTARALLREHPEDFQPVGLR